MVEFNRKHWEGEQGIDDRGIGTESGEVVSQKQGQKVWLINRSHQLYQVQLSVEIRTLETSNLSNMEPIGELGKSSSSGLERGEAELKPTKK